MKKFRSRSFFFEVAYSSRSSITVVSDFQISNDAVCVNVRVSKFMRTSDSCYCIDDDIESDHVTPVLRSLHKLPIR